MSKLQCHEGHGKNVNADTVQWHIKDFFTEISTSMFLKLRWKSANILQSVIENPNTMYMHSAIDYKVVNNVSWKNWFVCKSQAQSNSKFWCSEV